MILKSRFLATVLLGAGFFLGLAAAHAEDQPLKNYLNCSRDYALKYPSSLIPQPPPTSGDGRRFQSPDKTVTLVSWSAPMLNGDTIQSLLQRDSTDHDITYRVLRPSWFVISGKKDNEVYYEKLMVGRSSYIAFVLTYPMAQQAKYAPLVAPISKSLRFTDEEEVSPQPPHASGGPSSLTYLGLVTGEAMPAVLKSVEQSGFAVECQNETRFTHDRNCSVTNRAGPIHNARLFFRRDVFAGMTFDFPPDAWAAVSASVRRLNGEPSAPLHSLGRGETMDWQVSQQCPCEVISLVRDGDTRSILWFNGALLAPINIGRK